MRRARLAAQLGGDALDVDVGARIGEVQVGGLGVEHQRGAGALDQALVGLEIARVGFQILARGELDGVHEHADHDAVVLGDGALDQALVALVQIAHGGNEAHAQALRLPLADNLFRLFRGGGNGKHFGRFPFECDASAAPAFGALQDAVNVRIGSDGGRGRGLSAAPRPLVIA